MGRTTTVLCNPIRHTFHIKSPVMCTTNTCNVIPCMYISLFLLFMLCINCAQYISRKGTLSRSIFFYYGYYPHNTRYLSCVIVGCCPLQTKKGDVQVTPIIFFMHIPIHLHAYTKRIHVNRIRSMLSAFVYVVCVVSLSSAT